MRRQALEGSGEEPTSHLRPRRRAGPAPAGAPLALPEARAEEAAGCSSPWLALLAIGMAGRCPGGELALHGDAGAPRRRSPERQRPGLGNRERERHRCRPPRVPRTPGRRLRTDHREPSGDRTRHSASIRFTGVANLSRLRSRHLRGPPGGGTMGLSGLAKICLFFAPCPYAHVPIPLTPTTGGAGFGIGGTVTHPGGVSRHHAARPLDDRPAGDDDPHPEQHDHDPVASRRLRPRPGLADLQHRAGRGRAPDGDCDQGLHQPDRRLPRAAGLRRPQSGLPAGGLS